MSALAIALILGGVFFLTVSTVGMLRLPDFFSRTHAAGKSETLGAMLVLTGLTAHQGFQANSLKLLLIVFLVAVTGPTAVHALTRAALRSGMDIGGGAAERTDRPARDRGEPRPVAEPAPSPEGAEMPGR